MQTLFILYFMVKYGIIENKLSREEDWIIIRYVLLFSVKWQGLCPVKIAFKGKKTQPFKVDVIFQFRAGKLRVKENHWVPLVSRKFSVETRNSSRTPPRTSNSELILSAPGIAGVRGERRFRYDATMTRLVFF